MANVGEKTDKKTQAGRDVYKTPKGEMVSEKSTTFEYKGKWINIPTIHDGKQYSQDQLIDMLDRGLIKPTSVHNKLEEAVKAAKSRSKSLKFSEGGLSDNPVPDFLVGKNRGVNPRGVPYDREINDQMESLKAVGQFAWESLPGIGTYYTVEDIKEELAKENPNYYAIGALAGAEIIGLIPGLGDAAAELIKKGARSAGKLGSKIDKAVDQTTALLGGPKAKDVVKNEMAGFTGQNPPTYKKRDTALSQQEDFEPDFDESGVIKPKGIPSEKTRLRKDNIMQFREPIAEFAKTVTIPKKGLLGSEFLKMIKKNESIADSSLQPQIIDPKKRYTREELLEAIGLQDQYPGPNVFESNAYINNTMGGEMYAAYQRQGKDAGFLDIEKELGYFEIPIVSNVPSGFEGTGKNFKANSQHFVSGTIAHVRGSIVQPHDLETTAWWPITNTSASLRNYESLIDGKPFLFVEEIQSDLLQKGYAKPKSLTDAAFNKATEEWSRNNVTSFQEMFGDISKNIKNIFEELDEAGMVRPDLVDGFGAKDKFQRNAVNRGYVLSNELEEVLDNLNLTEEFIEPSVTDLTLTGRDRDLPIVDVDTGAELSRADFIKRFKKEKFLTPREKTQKFFDKSRELLAKKLIDKEINFNDFQNLYERYKANQYRLSRGGYHQDIGLPPITKNKQAVEESLKTLIAKAAQSGVDRIVIPPAERIAYARGRDIDPNNKGDRFYRTYVSDLDKALKDLEKNYPVKVHRDVELPYESKERMIDETEATANFYEVATDFIRQNLIEHEGISVPQDIDLEALNRAADKERFLSPLSVEEDAAFRTFAKHNQISLDEAGDAFDNWFDGQLRHLQGVDGFDEIQKSLSTQVSYKGIILDVSQLVDEYKVEAPRQFAKGGSPRPKLRPEGFANATSPRPRLRPSEDEVRYVDAVFRGEDGDIITSPEENNPVTMLGLTRGDTFRQYPNELSIYGAYLKPSDRAEGGPHKSKLQDLYAREKPDSPPLLINDILIAGKQGVENRYTAAHEFMHRGFNVLRSSHSFDEVNERFGRATAQILFSERADLEHALVQSILEKEGKIAGIDYTSKDYLKDASKEIRDKLKKSVEDIYELANETLGEAGYQTDRDRGPTTRQGRRGAKPKSFWSFITEKLGFAEGGTVDMNQQMSFAFEDGGLRDDGMNQDPVSGNEVPPGSTAKEVRDDIPAQLSEGEYVVPADVVRYYGVKFFEDLRDNAKMGLQDMESRGRIGGEPVPAGGPTNNDDLSAEELSAIKQMMGMNIGGFVDTPMYNEDPYAQQQSQYTVPMQMNKGGPVRGYQPGGGVTAQDNVSSKTMEDYFLRAANLTGQNNWMMPLGSTIFPDANTGKTIFESSPPQQTAETLIYLYGPNGEVRSFTSPLSDADKKIYEDLIAQGYTTEKPETLFEPEQMGSGGDDNKDTPETDPNGWMNKFDYTFNEDGTGFKNLADQTSNLLTKIPLGGAVGAMANGIKAAQAAANIIIMKANGQETQATALEAELKQFIKGTSLGLLPDELINGDQLAKSIMLKHTNLARANATDLNGKPLFKSEEDFRNHMSKVLPKTVSSPGLSGKTAESVAEKVKEQEVMSQQVKPSSNNDDSLSHEEIMEKHYGTNWSDTQTAEQQQASEEATGGIGSETGGWTPKYPDGTPMWNKGGLMATKPKRKTKRQYKKGGLAGKK